MRRFLLILSALLLSLSFVSCGSEDKKSNKENIEIVEEPIREAIDKVDVVGNDVIKTYEDTVTTYHYTENGLESITLEYIYDAEVDFSGIIQEQEMFGYEVIEQTDSTLKLQGSQQLVDSWNKKAPTKEELLSILGK